VVAVERHAGRLGAVEAELLALGAPAVLTRVVDVADAAPGPPGQMDATPVAAAVWDALQDGRFWVLPMQASMREDGDDPPSALDPCASGVSSCLGRPDRRIAEEPT
jgi:hypothetical protein